jgi:hypothetical protein
VNTSSPRDGAHVRRERLLDIIDYIDGWELDAPCGVETVCVMMTLRHGLTRQRTQLYLRELELAHVLRMSKNGGYSLAVSREKLLATIGGASPRDQFRDT